MQVCIRILKSVMSSFLHGGLYIAEIWMILLPEPISIVIGEFEVLREICLCTNIRWTNIAVLQFACFSGTRISLQPAYYATYFLFVVKKSPDYLEFLYSLIFINSLKGALMIVCGFYSILWYVVSFFDVFVVLIKKALFFFVVRVYCFFLYDLKCKHNISRTLIQLYSKYFKNQTFMINTSRYISR